MRRRLVIWFAIVATVLVVSASPASAASVVSINTTDQDFQSASLDDMRVSGSGDSASVTGEVGYSDQIDTLGVSQSDIGTAARVGVVFEVNSSKGAVWGNPNQAATNFEPDALELRYHSNGTLIERTTFSGTGRVGFEADMEPSVEYRLVIYREGSSHEFDEFQDAPLSTPDLKIKSGIVSGTTQSAIAGFETISVGNASDLKYSGPEHTADASTLFANVSTGVSTTITAQANTGSGWTAVDSATVSNPQNVSLDISTSSATRFRTVVEASNEAAEQSVTLYDEGVTFGASSPSLSNPDPADGSDLDSFGGEISVDISDGDFALPQGDSVTVVASNSKGQIGSTTISQNDTAAVSYTPLGGPNNITWTATDTYGNSETLTQNFSAPSRLEVRNETNGSQLVNDVEVTLRFYREDNQTVITKSTSNGIISMAGLPADEAFVATAEANGYVSRRIYVGSLLEQERIYLLNESAQTVEIEFEIDDSTGQFSDSDTVLTIEKPVTIDGETEFRTIVGDRVSASGRLPATLEEGARYRLTVSNDGQTRSLGSYTPTVSGIEPLPIGQISVSGDFDKGWLLEHSIDETEQGDVLRLKYVDRANETTSIETEVVRLNESGGVVETILPNATETDTQSLVRSQVVTNSSDTFEVRYTIERGGETISERRKLGQLEGVDVPVPPGWLNLISWVAVFGFGGLVVIKDSRAAAVVMAGSASLFALLGWLVAPTAVLALATAGAIVYAVAGGVGGGY